MHIHASLMSLSGVNPYNAAAENAAVAAQRAARVRKRLSKSGQEIEPAVSPDESVLIDKWTDLRYGKGKNQGK